MKKERLRKRIFDSAKEIAQSEGMHQLNVRKLAKLSSCSLGSIYNAFGSFQELQLHINANTLRDLYQVLNKTAEEGTKSGKSLREVFRDLGFTYVEFGLKNRLLWKGLFEHSSNATMPDWYKKNAREGIYQICTLLSKAYGLPEAKSKKIVGFFWAAIHGVSAIYLNRKMEMVAELFDRESVTPYVEYCLDGLFKEVSDEQLVCS